MAHFSSILIFALLCPWLSAAESKASGTCSEDDDKTSLMQVKQTVTKGRDRVPPTEHEEAVIDANNIEDGSIADAYDNNLHKEKDAITSKVDPELDFEVKVRNERRQNLKSMKNRIHREKKEYDDAVDTDRQEVEAEARHRHEVEENVKEEVKDAAAKADAYGWKSRVERDAAVAGRLAGAREGYRAAERRIAAEHDAHEMNVENRKLAAEVKAAEERRADHRRAMDETSKHLEDEEDDLVDHARDAKEAGEMRAQVHTIEAKEGIHGPDDMTYHDMQRKANRALRESERSVSADRERIDEATHAAWPKGDWPDP